MKIFTNIPKIDGVEKKTSEDKTNVFPASNVNLGWLKKRAEEYWLQTSSTDDEFKTDLTSEIYSSVQFIRTIEIAKKQAVGNKWLEISFVTKDDLDYYSYSFSVRLADKFTPRLVK